MSSIEEIFKNFNSNINRNITSNPNFVRSVATGSMRESVLNESNVSISKTKFTKRVKNYADFIDKGRGKYSGGGNANLWGRLYEWVGLKKYDISYSDDKGRKRITWAIYKKMQKEGSFKHRNPSRQTDIFNSAVQASINELRKDLLKEVRSSQLSVIRSEFKSVK